MNLTATLDQFEDICLNALSCASVLDKKGNTGKPLRGRLKCRIFGIILLFIVLPRKINFTQMVKYGMHTEMTYREAFRTLIDWFHANYALLMNVSKPTKTAADAGVQIHSC